MAASSNHEAGGVCCVRDRLLPPASLHTVFNKTNEPMVHVLFEILPADLNGPSLIPVKHH